MKCQVDEMSSWQNVKLMKSQVDKILEDEMSSGWNVKLTKCASAWSEIEHCI